jgi:hypothetical protein
MADSPKEAEAAQALFCSIADYVGKNKIDNILNLDSFNTYYLFKKSNQKVLDIAYKQLDVPGISIQQIEKFLTDKTDWYQSSIIIAKKVIKSLSTIEILKNYQNQNGKIFSMLGVQKQIKVDLLILWKI